jgi:hypothetical protein
MGFPLPVAEPCLLIAQVFSLLLLAAVCVRWAVVSGLASLPPCLHQRSWARTQAKLAASKVKPRTA